REELARQEEQELEIINSYLPKQISKEEVELLVSGIIVQTGASSPKDFGKVMPLAMKELKGKIDGKIIQEIVKQKLGGT
ncbi:MAG TPA: GatB/YqeY domain-containing protein, partial [Bacteroidota bacterium]